ncbi:MAG: S8 family serine peptidase [Candidatus Kapaibacteriales bacterium]
MRKIILLTFVFFLTYIHSYSLECEKGKLLIKLKKDSELEVFFQNGQKPFFLNKVLGDFTYYPAISPKLIDFAEMKFFSKNYRRLDPPFENLRRAYIVEYDKNLDPFYISKKLRNYIGIEYAEPLYVRKILKIPSDPRINQQYYLNKIKIFEAWDLLPANVDTIIVGIIDTGIDYEHPDLAENIYINYGEVGKDSLGRDKRENGIDDDNNGYIDDYRGWDFPNNDNDPKPVNGHGTHVAGIIGAIVDNDTGGCGLVPKVKLLACKCSPDDNGSIILSGYKAIFYSAVMGANVINCSWGSTGYSNFEQEVINSVNQLGCSIVSAAGNNSALQDFYPASYDGVLSVSALDSNDLKAGFSNYSVKVDISAPGVDIFSTVPGNTYAAWDGTSMASPIAAGVLALIRQKFQSLKPKQYYEILKKTSDDIYPLNENFVGLLGAGRVNAFNALSINLDTMKAVLLKDVIVANPQSLIDNDSTIPLAVFISLENIFSKLENVSVKLSPKTQFIRKILVDSIYLGDFEAEETKLSDKSLVFFLSENVPYDHNLILLFDIFVDNKKIGTYSTQFVVRHSYRTMQENNISVTFNSRGNIGYNDFPNNIQGDGFSFRKSNSLLFEGAVIVGTSTKRVSDVARNYNTQNRAFMPEKYFVTHYKMVDDDKIKPYNIGLCSFSDLKDTIIDTLIVGLNVSQTVYQFTEPEDSNFIIVKYDVKNISPNNYDSVYFGLFFDWDISSAGQEDETRFDILDRFAYAHSPTNDSLVFVGTQLLSALPLNYYPIDNDGSGEDSLGIYDGYTITEKLKTLSKGIVRKKTRTTDISYVISAGPFALMKGDSKPIVFSIFAGKDLLELRQSSIYSLKKAINLGIINDNQQTRQLSLPWKVFPVIFNDELNVCYSANSDEDIELMIYDNLGRRLSSIKTKTNKNRENLFTFNTSEFARGIYFIILQTKGLIEVNKAVKIR